MTFSQLRKVEAEEGASELLRGEKLVVGTSSTGLGEVGKGGTQGVFGKEPKITICEGTKKKEGRAGGQGGGGNADFGGCSHKVEKRASREKKKTENKNKKGESVVKF